MYAPAAIAVCTCLNFKKPRPVSRIAVKANIKNILFAISKTPSKMRTNKDLQAIPSMDYCLHQGVKRSSVQPESDHEAHDSVSAFDSARTRRDSSKFHRFYESSQKQIDCALQNHCAGPGSHDLALFSPAIDKSNERPSNRHFARKND